jgi:hypothetical protein
MQGAKAMLEPAVGCTRINKACKPELFYISQPLKPWVFNNIIYQIPRDANEPINRIIYDFSFVSFVHHPKFAKLQNYEFVLITAIES